MRRWWGSLLASVLVVLTSCQDREPVVGQPIPNSPPDTDITATPPLLDRAEASVTFYWRGTDPDGEITGFEWRISTNGRDGIVDVSDTLQSRLPWHFTTASDSTFFVSADVDSFRRDVEDPDLEPGEYRFWQTHTLFVRAIDDHDARDPTPAHVSFTATTLAPTVVIDVPPVKPTNTCNIAARVLTFGWRARDADDPDKEPAFVRWILYPFDLGGGCATVSEFESRHPIGMDDPLWSPWIPYDAPADSGRTVTLPKQLPGTKFLFAVQAKDASGAVTPTLEWNRNVRYVHVTEGMLPLLRVQSNVRGTDLFVGTRQIKLADAIQDQTLSFGWEGDASDYAGIIDAYRYGWNVADPTDPRDPGWAVEWGNGPSWRRSAPRAFSQGSPNLVIQCRDNSGTVTRAFYQFQILTYAERSSQRNLLIVDDYPNGNTSTEINLDLTWDARWKTFFLNRVVGFGDADMLDAQQDPRRLDFSTLGEYKAVIWFTSANQNTFFRQQVASLPAELNWVEVYQSRVGNLLLCGPSALYGGIRGLFDRLPLILSHNGRGRWGYDAWCTDAVSIVRPAGQSIYGETPGFPRRSRVCDGLIVAQVADAFLETYPDAVGRVHDLHPLEEREVQDPQYLPDWEEFYNTNATNLAVLLTPRPCQTPMFLHRARRDEGRVENPLETCYPHGRDVSTINQAPIGLVSRVYSDTKPLPGSEDFLWGFHPMSFDAKDVQDALLWIAGERWQLPLR